MQRRFNFRGPLDGDADLARYLLARIEHETGAGPTFDGASFWFYEKDSGVWTKRSSIELAAFTQRFHRRRPGKISRHLSKGAIEVMSALVFQRDFFRADVPALAFSNGTFDLVNERLVAHDPLFRATISFPFELSFRVRPTNFLAFLHDVWQPDADWVEKVQALQEFLGAALFGIAPTFEKCCVFYGRTGRNGKSRLMDAIKFLFPPHSVRSVRPQDWGNEYYAAELAGARINLVGELPRGELVDTGPFKAIVSGNEITGREIREAPTRFAPQAAHIFATNKLPPINDPDEAFWRRFIMLSFNRTFDGDVLPEKIVGPLRAEVAAIIPWAIEGALRLRRQGLYTSVPSSTELLRRWRVRADQVQSFLGDATLVFEKAVASVGEAYSEYRHWAYLTGHKKLSLSAFSERLAALGFEARRGEIGNHFRGFELRERNEWELEEQVTLQ